MNTNNSPLDFLAAFAIVFFAGAFAAAGLTKIIEKTTKKLPDVV